MITLDTEHIYSVSEADDILKEAIKGGTCYKSKSLDYYNIVAAFDIETSNFRTIIDDTYKFEYIYHFINGVTLRCPDIDIESFGKVSGIKLSKTRGEALDSFYRELCDTFPGFLDDGLIDPNKQLISIIDLMLINKPTNEDEDKASIMYCWQFAINGKVIFGRTWDQFLDLIDLIECYTDIHKRLIVYCHNLAMEFQYIRRLLSWHKVFSISKRKPIYSITKSGIEFRCSYILTNYNLENLAKQLKKYDVKKLVGNLDYNLVRSPETPMTREEISYCINDVLVVSAYIQECILKERYISNIPLTATGYCRRYCRNMCLYGTVKKLRKKQYNKYRALMLSLTIDGKEEYEQLKRAFGGGFTHCNARFSGRTQNNVESWDEASAYIFTAAAELMPMSKGRKVYPTSKAEFENYINKYCCIFDAEFIDLEATFLPDQYISAAHCFVKEDAVRNNGRIYSASRIITTITNVDYEIIRKTYRFKTMKVLGMRIYKRGFLPKELQEAIIKLYKDKTELKGVVGKEDEYMNAKALLNSVYGMMVTDICKDEIIYDDTWSVKEVDVEKAINKYNNSPKRFLFYPWGIFITAYSRLHLWQGILAIGDDYIYADTDSLKILNGDKHRDFFECYNAWCGRKCDLMCKHLGIDPEGLRPKTEKGIPKPIGVFENETEDKNYDCFRSLGAKRYLTKQHYEFEDDTRIFIWDEYHLTVAGVNKKVALPYLIETYGDKIMDNFRIGLKIPKGKTGKLTHVYIDDPISGELVDYMGNRYKYVNQPPGIYLEAAEYDFSITEDYYKFLKGVQSQK